MDELVVFVIGSGSLVAWLAYNNWKRENQPTTTTTSKSTSSSSSTTQPISAIRTNPAPARTGSKLTLDMDTGVAALKKDVTEKWSGPLSSLPVPIDFPRLARKTAILRNGKVVCKMADESHDVLVGSKDFIPTVDALVTAQKEAMQTILVSLAREFESEQRANEIEKAFQKSFFDNPSAGELSRTLEQFLQETLGTDSKPARILKGFNQSIVAPAIFRLKLTVGMKIPYKDIRGGWKVFIEFNDDAVIISNQKWEQSADSDSFQFSWKLDIILDKELTTVKDVKFKIVELTFGPRCKEAAQQQTVKDACAIWM